MAKSGFGSMDPAKQQEIAGKGGRAVHQKGVAFEFEPGSEKAAEAGRRGVKVRQGICPDCGAKFMTKPTPGCTGCKKYGARKAKRERNLPRG